MSNEAQISLKNVNKSFGAHHVLNDVNIDINKGDFICIFGKSGGGKTTLLNCISTIDQASAGHIFIDDQELSILGTLETYDNGEMRSFEKLDPIKKKKKKECELLRRNNIAYLFQNFALVEKMTVEDNMKLAVKYNKAKNKKELIQTALDKMGVGDKLKSKVYELSGGEQQRVAIARNMVKPFDIMLADEPTGSLDDENKSIVIDTLLALNKEGKTIVVVSHDKDFKKIASKSYLISEGKLEVLNET